MLIISTLLRSAGGQLMPGLRSGTFDITSSSTYTSGSTSVFTLSGTTLTGVSGGSSAATSHSFRNTVSVPMCPAQTAFAPQAPVKVQQPTSLRVVSATSVGCDNSVNYGNRGDVKYQVLDQDGQ